MLSFYYDEYPLFDCIITTPWLSNAVQDLILMIDRDDDLKYNFHLLDGKPILPDNWRDGSTEQFIELGNKWLKQREENALKRKANWDIFIKYLTDAGKIIQ